MPNGLDGRQRRSLRHGSIASQPSSLAPASPSQGSTQLNCDSAASAATAFSVIHEHYGVDASIHVPQDLGPSAFATASIAPQYLMVWRVGSKVAITAVDVNLAASTATSSSVPSTPLTKAQEGTLFRAAEAQNALFG